MDFLTFFLCDFVIRLMRFLVYLYRNGDLLVFSFFSSFVFIDFYAQHKNQKSSNKGLKLFFFYLVAKNWLCFEKKRNAIFSVWLNWRDKNYFTLRRTFGLNARVINRHDNGNTITTVAIGITSLSTKPRCRPRR